jgi:fatty acid desaturase
MPQTFQKRDYSLTGPENAAARAKGLASAEWYRCAIPRKQMKELMQRRDGPAIRDTLILYSAIIAAGVLAYLSWGTWWAIPAFALYGVLYAAPGDSRWHECGHGTAFKTQWMNTVVYNIASFMVMREPTPWRWSHARHHTDTIIIGRDPEIALSRPPDLLALALNAFHIKNAFAEMGKVVRHSFGRISAAERDFIPESEFPRVFRTARIWVAIYLGVIIACIATRSILPAMFIGLPSFYGAWMHLFFGLTQHVGLAEDTLDHRLNSRTVYMNPVFRFLYWNMNYHVEHHMFPMVPYHALPKLHEAMKSDTPPPYPSCWAAYKEIVPTLLRQLKDPTYFVKRPLPAKAAPAPEGAMAVPAE